MISKFQRVVQRGCSFCCFSRGIFAGRSLWTKKHEIVLVSHPSVNPWILRKKNTWRPFKLIIKGVHWRWKANIITNPLKILVWKFVDRNVWQNTHSKFLLNKCEKEIVHFQVNLILAFCTLLGQQQSNYGKSQKGGRGGGGGYHPYNR